MLETVREKAISVTSNIFETMFFTFLEIGENENQSVDLSSPLEFLRGEIEFSGRQTGRLTLELPVELAQTMASNFMGLEEEKASDSQAEDVVKELCNMICGNLFSRVDHKSVWNLTIPQAKRVSALEWNRGLVPSEIVIHFDAGGYPVKLRLCIDEAYKSEGKA